MVTLSGTLVLTHCLHCTPCVQYTGYNSVTGKITSKPGPDVMHISGMKFLDNNMVNFMSASTTALVTALVALKMFGF